MLIFLQVINDVEMRSKLEDIYYLYNKDIYYVAYNILKDRHEAEDIVQTTILKLANHLDKISDIHCKRSRAFVVIVAKNLARNAYNKRKSKELIPIDEYADTLLDEKAVCPEQHVLRLDNGHWVAKQLEQIKPEYAEVLSLKYAYEYSNKEIGLLMDISEGNVRIRLFRAKKALEKIIGGG